MAVAAPRAPVQAKVRPPYPLVPAPKTTTSHEEEGDACEDAEGIESFLHQRVDESGCAEKFSKRTRWAVLRLAAEASTESVYDDMWAALGKEGKRWLSVAEHRGALWALLYKGDDGEVDLTAFPATLYGVPRAVTAGGPASRAATADFARAWLGHAKHATSNFIVESDEEQQATAKGMFEDCRGLSDEAFLLTVAAAKVEGASPRAQLMKKISPELKAFRSVDKKQQKAVAHILQDPCYKAVGPEGLHMPTDFVDVAAWLGETWAPESGAHTLTFLHWLNSPEHLERTAVVYGDSGSGKTAVLHATARTLAMRYQDEPYYLCAGTVNGLRSPHRKGLLKQGVPRVIEDYAPTGNPNGKRQPLGEYLVNLFNVKDGGSIDMPGGSQMILPPAAPQLISTNREFGAWIEGFQQLPMELQHAISKRVVFFRLPDKPLVQAEQRKRRREDMTAMVAAGLERERKFLRGRREEEASTAAAPSEVGLPQDAASSDGVFCEGPSSSESSAEENDGTCWASEQPSGDLIQQLCPACSVSPPGAPGSEVNENRLSDTKRDSESTSRGAATAAMGPDGQDGDLEADLEHELEADLASRDDDLASGLAR